jgi:HEAT repeat protein
LVVARESVSALGRIASPDALETLMEAKVADGLKAAVQESRLLCADALLAKGKADQAADVYRGALGEGNPEGVRAAALIGLARAVKDDALPAIFEMLKRQDSCSQRAAGSALMEIKGEHFSKAMVDELGRLSADAQVIALHVLAVNGTKNITPDIVKLTGSAEKTVRVAAIQALAALGDVADIELLAGLAKEGGEVGRVVVESLCRRSGKGASEAIMKVLPRVDAASRALLVGCLAERQSREVVSELFRYADDSDEHVRVQTFKALGTLVQEEEIPTLIGLMLSAKPDRVRLAAERAVSVASAKVEGVDRRTAPLVAAMKDANPEGRASLLHCLGSLGGEKALDMVRVSIRDRDENVQEAAIRVMADWKDEGAVADLCELAKNAPKENLKIIAFRGLVRIVEQFKSPGPERDKAMAELKTLAETTQTESIKKQATAILDGVK